MDIHENHYEPYSENNWEESSPQFGGGGQGSSWLGALRDLWQWDSLAAEIGQENQARVAFVGLAGAGKSLLFNRLRGWDISHEPLSPPEGWMVDVLPLESLGMFLLVDLPGETGQLSPERDVLLMLGNPALFVYLIDGEQGVTPADYRWVATLRASGRPVIAVLNKVDLLDNPDEALSTACDRLGMPILSISALTGLGIENDLFPAMLDAVPRLAAPLGRELTALRHMAARRIIRQTAVLAGILGAEPVPFLDLPVQIMLQVGVVMRIGAAFGSTPSGGINREILGTIAGTLSLRYLAAAIVKTVPVLGWAAASLLSSGTTLLIGETALKYYASGKKLSFMNTRLHQARRKRWLRARHLPPVNQDNPTVMLLPEEDNDPNDRKIS